MGCHPGNKKQIEANFNKLIVRKDSVASEGLLEIKSLNEKHRICSKVTFSPTKKFKSFSPSKHSPVKNKKIPITSLLSSAALDEYTFTVENKGSNTLISASVGYLCSEQFIPVIIKPSKAIKVAIEGNILEEDSKIDLSSSTEDRFLFRLNQDQQFYCSNSAEIKTKQKSYIFVSMPNTPKESKGTVKITLSDVNISTASLPEIDYLPKENHVNAENTLIACRIRFAAAEPQNYAFEYLENINKLDFEPNLLSFDNKLASVCERIFLNFKDNVDLDEVDRVIRSFFTGDFQWKHVLVSLDISLRGVHALSNALLSNKDLVKAIFDNKMNEFGLFRATKEQKHWLYLFVFKSKT